MEIYRVRGLRIIVVFFLVFLSASAISAQDKKIKKQEIKIYHVYGYNYWSMTGGYYKKKNFDIIEKITSKKHILKISEVNFYELFSPKSIGNDIWRYRGKNSRGTEAIIEISFRGQGQYLIDIDQGFHHDLYYCTR